MRQRFGGPKLPKELRDQIGDPAYRGKAGGRNGQLNRRDRRKAERGEKKAQKRQSGNRRQHRPEPESVDEDEETDKEEALPKAPAPSKEVHKPLKGILKKSPNAVPEPTSSRSPSPIISRTVKDRLKQDDAEIAALEKKLGIKGGKSVKDFDDGLDELFGGLSELDSDNRTPKRKRTQDDTWLANKRRKALGAGHLEAAEADVNSDDSEAIEWSQDDAIEDDSDFEGFESDVDEENDILIQPRVRENPYVAPITLDAALAPKYVPPSFRAPPASDVEALSRLKRQIQGLLNRLSDANLLTILRDIEQIYQSNPRGYVNTTIVDLLIGLLADETMLMDTFLILHAGFIASIYKIIGPEFAAQIVERIVSEFDQNYERTKPGSGKQATNLISLVAELYIFQVIGSNLIFDYIKVFLDQLSEINTELLLRIVKVSGSQLRQDDPTSLKDIVLLLQKSVTKVGESNLPVRTKFMIETINNLKNNRMKAGVGASAIVNEHTIRMKKQLGTLNTRNLKGAEPLQVGLADIRDTDKRGKWWLVGASWRRDEALETAQEAIRPTAPKQSEETLIQEMEDGEVDLLQLAREQRMNTDTRRAIFITIMSAVDFKDAYVRLIKLNLKRAQRTEIPRVIVHCAGCEKTYNPYYALVARKFCSDHQSRKTFQFALWDFLTKLGEKKDDDDNASVDEDETETDDTSLRRLVNVGKLYGTLIANDGLPINTLKTLNFAYLQPKTKTFLEIMLVTVILQSQKGLKSGRDEKKLENIFIDADKIPQMVPGLQYFLRKVVINSEIIAGKAEKETLRWACKAIVGMLKKAMATIALRNDE